MQKRKYKQQEDRLLKRLSYVERQRQERLRRRIVAEYSDVLLYA